MSSYHFSFFMLTPVLMLRDFLINVPLCQENISLTQILALFCADQSELICVVNENSFPLGVIRYHGFLDHFTKFFSAISPPVDFDSLSEIHDLIDTRITILPAQMSIEDFFPYLQEDEQQIFTLVDSEGDFLGLLNQNKLLKFLIENYVSLSENLSNFQNECQQLTARNIDLMQMLHWRNQLLASWSHQLKSPVTALVALSNLLQEKKLGTLNPRQANYAQQIYQSSRQLMGLLSLTIDLTYGSSGQLMLKPKPLEIHSFCQELCQDLTSHIPIKIEVNSRLNMMIADHLQLRKILIYLLKNAINFTPDDGQIGLKVEPWCNWIAFTIWHYGCGITVENQLSLFQECQPLDNPLTGKFEGTGLELILSQQMAFTSGGDISFISQIDQGSEFTLLLPPVFPPPLNQEKKTNLNLVLMVETDVVIINNLRENLRDLGYFVIVARSAIEAYRKAYQLKPNFIFCNDNLSLTSPIDLINLLKNDSITKDIIIFNLTIISHLPYTFFNDNSQYLLLNKGNLSNLLNQFSIPEIIDNLTILLLSPLNFEFELGLNNHASSLNYRVISCNSLKQAAQINNFWSINVIILDARNSQYPVNYWLTLKDYSNLVDLPFVTLDTQITSLMNQINNLKVFPYLPLSENSNLADLFQVINIAIR